MAVAVCGITRFVSDNPWRALVLAATVGCAGYIVKKAVETVPLLYVIQPKKKVDFRENVVYLHQFPLSWTRQVPNLSPFAIKLETWLRLKKIQYQIVEIAVPPSKGTGQIPYVVFNGQTIFESNHIIDVLTKYFHLDPTEGLMPQQYAISRAFQRMLDEATSWGVFLQRYSLQPETYTNVTRLANSRLMSVRIIRLIGRQVWRRCNIQGIGRQPPEVYKKAGRQDIQAISVFLADKMFLTGESITMVDCVAFGHLCQVAFTDFPYFHKEAMDFKLLAYLDRIREELWPDWLQRVTCEPFAN